MRSNFEDSLGRKKKKGTPDESNADGMRRASTSANEPAPEPPTIPSINPFSPATKRKSPATTGSAEAPSVDTPNERDPYVSIRNQGFGRLVPEDVFDL